MQLQNFFRAKNKEFGPVQIPKKNIFLNFFHRFLSISSIRWVFDPVPNAIMWYFSDLVPLLKVNIEYLLNPKSTTFSHLVPEQRPTESMKSKEIDEKNSKKFFWVIVLVQIPYLWI
jgi:hypothetical protein